jgi:glutamine synthetase
MKINFTKKEYHLLVTMIEIADWVLNAHHADDQPKTKEYKNLRNKILSYAREMGMGDCYYQEEEEYFETKEHEENSDQMAFIEEYNENTFWDQLVNKLVDRDYEKKYGFDDDVDIKTRFERLMEFEEIYNNEINEFGIKNLTFRKFKPDIH